jgi:DNA replication protein DnaC
MKFCSATLNFQNAPQIRHKVFECFYKYEKWYKRKTLQIVGFGGFTGFFDLF